MKETGVNMGVYEVQLTNTIRNDQITAELFLEITAPLWRVSDASLVVS